MDAITNLLSLRTKRAFTEEAVPDDILVELTGFLMKCAGSKLQIATGVEPVNPPIKIIKDHDSSELVRIVPDRVIAHP